MRKMIKYHSEGGFSGVNLAPYTGKDGKAVQWHDAFGNPTDTGPFLKRKNTLVDTTGANPFPRGEELIAYIKDHPLTRAGLISIQDLDAEEKARRQKLTDRSTVLGKMYKMSEKDLRDFLTLARLPNTGGLRVMQERVLSMCETEEGVKKIGNAMNTQDRAVRVVLYQAVDSDLIHLNGNYYRIGGPSGELIGINEEQAIDWCKEHKEEFNLLKKQIEKVTAKA